MSDKFKLGDCVKLASGGPQMTVISVSAGNVECSWFDKEHRCRKNAFPEAAVSLTPAEELSDEQLARIIQKEKTTPPK